MIRLDLIEIISDRCHFDLTVASDRDDGESDGLSDDGAAGDDLS